MKQAVLETLLEMHEGLVEFVLFSCRCIFETIRVQLNYHSHRCCVSLILVYWHKLLLKVHFNNTHITDNTNISNNTKFDGADLLLLKLG